MVFKRVTTPKDKMYQEALKLYSISFPAHEQREAESQARILSDSAYHFDLIYDGNIFVGLMLNWETQDFTYVEHFCIWPELRNQKYGQRSLKHLCRMEKTIILEIDPPVDTVSKSRKSFYERNGFVDNPYSHVHPPYHRGSTGHNLVIMSHPNKISQAGYDMFHCYLEQRVMKDVSH